MPDLSQFTLPSGSTYNMKDAVARAGIAGIGNKHICWKGTSTPDVSIIPYGVIVTYQGTDYVGTLSPVDPSVEPKSMYLVNRAVDGAPNRYEEFSVVTDETTTPTTVSWESMGFTDVKLEDLGDLAYADTVELLKGQGADVLGKNTTFGTTVGNVAVGGNGTAQAVIGYTPSTEQFIKNVSASKKKLVRGTFKPVTNVGSAPQLTFNVDGERLIIGWNAGAVPTLGNDTNFATGSVSDDGTGDEVAVDAEADSTGQALTALGTPTTQQVLTGVQVTQQPTVQINVGTNDQVKVARYADLNTNVNTQQVIDNDNY